MGLSVLIPVYNFNVTSLVNALVSQLAKSGRQGEIIILDDGSTNFISENQSLQNSSFVSFYKNETNKGRMFSRQKLASLAQHNYLLFLDCDSEIIKDDFLATYFFQIENTNSLACGGRVYSAKPPADCDLMLHWKYGTIRESVSSKKLNGKRAFMSNNFLIRKELFLQLDNSLEMPGYGHEDSWWGIQFEQMRIECLHINNPVLHSALEKAEIFLAKSENALRNLLLLEKNTDKVLLKKHIKIFQWYCKLANAGMSGLFIFFENPLHNYFRKNLLSCKPNLFYFDCYRLATLIRMVKSASFVK